MASTHDNRPISSRTRSNSIANTTLPSTTDTTTTTTATRPPPRYSGLGLTPPSDLMTIEAPAAPQQLSPSSSSGSSTPADLDVLRPPRYSSVFVKETVERTLRSRPRRVNPNHCHPDQTFDSIAPVSHSSSAANPINYFLNHSQSAPQQVEYPIRTGSTSKGDKQSLGVLRLFALGMTRVYNSGGAGGSISSSEKIPKFSEGENVNGVLELKFDTPQTVASIQVSLRGRITTGSYEEDSFTFLDQPVVSWSKSQGDPRRSVSPPPGVAEHMQRKKFDGKLSGEYLWPFSFPFPGQVVLPGHSPNRAQRLPQTFSERNSNVVVKYELVVRISHGMLRLYSRLSVPVAYLPEIAPPPLALLRQLAYSEQCPIPTPSVDPEGWHTIHPVTLQTKVGLKNKPAEVHCTLSVANPQCYTRSTFIPCHLTLQSTSQSALRLVSDPERISVRLVRRVKFHTDPKNGALASTPSSFKEQVSVMERAVWWIPQTESSAMETSTGSSSSSLLKTVELQGEIHLDKNLQPSCDFGLLNISYSVEFYAFDATTTTNSSSKSSSSSSSSPSFGDKPVLSHPVAIATRHADGPIPIAVTEPLPSTGRGSGGKGGRGMGREQEVGFDALDNATRDRYHTLKLW